MNVDERPGASLDLRPAWWIIALTTVGGVVAGGVFYLILVWAISLALDLTIGGGEWQSGLKALPDLLRVPLLILYWIIPLGLGQWLSVAASGWSKSAYFAAALQTFHLVSILSVFSLAYLWTLPALVALAFIFSGRARHEAEKSHARKARYRGGSHR